MLSQIQFQMLHCDVFQQHPLVGIEQIETGNRFQVVEPVTVDDLRSIAGVEHAGRISRRTPLLHVLIGIDGKDNQPGTAGRNPLPSYRRGAPKQPCNPLRGGSPRSRAS